MHLRLAKLFRSALLRRLMRIPARRPPDVVIGGEERPYMRRWWLIPRRHGQCVIPSRAPVAQPRDRLPNGHPCSRALVHFDWLVRWWSESGETVLDPFCGSGTTLLAAARQGRAAVGIEIDPGYAELARSRCAALDPLLRERAS